MARKQLIRSKYLPYHVTSRTNNKVWFKLPITEVFDIFSCWLNWAHLIYGVQTHLFVLMSNHFHWVVSTPNRDLGVSANFLLTQVSLEINESTATINHNFGARYRWSIISSARHYHHILKYGYRNPIKAGLCESVLDYPYSTLGYYRGTHPCPIWCQPHPFDGEQSMLNDEYIDWLNTPTPQEENEKIQKALNRKEFRFCWISGKKQFEPQPLPRWMKVDD